MATHRSARESSSGPAPPTPRQPGTSATRLVSLRDAAEVFGVSVKTIRRRIADGTVTGYRIGTLIRVDLDELRAALVVKIRSAR
jgi:excisionase family DNA binding protein